VVIAPLVVVVVAAAPREVFTLQILLIHPGLYHITKPYDGLGAVAIEVPKKGLVSDAVVVAVVDIFLGDVSDGGARVEEAVGVGAQELVPFLLALRQVITSTCPSDRSLEDVDEDQLQIILGIDGVLLEALQPHEWGSLQSHHKVDKLGGVGATHDFYGHGVAPDPLLRSLLAVVLGNPDRFEALQVRVQTKVMRELQKQSLSFGTQ
jgi:hypothetical protein